MTQLYIDQTTAISSEFLKELVKKADKVLPNWSCIFMDANGDFHAATAVPQPTVRRGVEIFIFPSDEHFSKPLEMCWKFHHHFLLANPRYLNFESKGVSIADQKTLEKLSPAAQQYIFAALSSYYTGEAEKDTQELQISNSVPPQNTNSISRPGTQNKPSEKGERRVS